MTPQAEKKMRSLVLDCPCFKGNPVFYLGDPNAAEAQKKEVRERRRYARKLFAEKDGGSDFLPRAAVPPDGS